MYYEECDNFEEDKEIGGCVHEDDKSFCSVYKDECPREYTQEDLWLQPN